MSKVALDSGRRRQLQKAALAGTPFGTACLHPDLGGVRGHGSSPEAASGAVRRRKSDALGDLMRPPGLSGPRASLGCYVTAAGGVAPGHDEELASPVATMPRPQPSTQPRKAPPCTDPGPRRRREDSMRAAAPGETQTGLRVRQVAVCASQHAAKEKKHKLVFTKQERAKRLGTGCAAARVPSTEPGLQCNDWYTSSRSGAHRQPACAPGVVGRVRQCWVCRLVRRTNGRSPHRCHAVTPRAAHPSPPTPTPAQLQPASCSETYALIRPVHGLRRSRPVATLDVTVRQARCASYTAHRTAAHYGTRCWRPPHHVHCR